MSNTTVYQLLKLSVLADESAKLARNDAENLKTATVDTFTGIAESILETMSTGSDYKTAASIARMELDKQCNDVIFNAIQNNEAQFADLGKLIRKADKLASRLMTCAYAIVHAAPSGKINKLETFAAHMRKGYPLCLVSHMGQAARLADSVDVNVNVDVNPWEKERANYEARIAELLTYNAMLAEAKEAAENAVNAVIHGGEIIGKVDQKKGRQRSRLVA